MTNPTGDDISASLVKRDEFADAADIADETDAANEPRSGAAAESEDKEKKNKKAGKSGADLRLVEPPDLDSSEYYDNRELSQLQFNLRVLEQARDLRHPLLERLSFLLIFLSNLDEFYEIRVSGLKERINSGRPRVGLDGRHPEQTLEIIHQQTREALDKCYGILNRDLLPSMERENIHFLERETWKPKLRKWAEAYFHAEVLPVISPLGLDPAHPFPRLVNKSLNFILALEGRDAFGRESGLAVVPAPRSLPRLIKVPREIISSGDNFVFLSSIIHEHVEQFFPGMRVTECHQFRVTRNADLEMKGAEVKDVASALKGELPARRFGAASKLEVARQCPEFLTDFLLQRFNLREEELFRLDGPVNLQRMTAVRGLTNRPDLCFPRFSPGMPETLETEQCIFTAVRQEDRLLLHPYQSFMPIIDWVRQAAKDPDVLSIKQTLYRTNKSSEMVEALAEAARNGKEVTAVIELRARFDEEDNIHFANILQEAGAVVVYGVMGYKTHAKMLLIVRRESDRLRYYAHLGTGNYHRRTSEVYTDYSLLTCDDTLGADVHKVFQQITGMGKKIRPRLLIHAPFHLKKSLLKMIDVEKQAAAAGRPARIIAKLNGLTDSSVIRALYEASQAGVKIDLIVRSVCCLRPGVPGVSDNIRVKSVVGRFLEHSRVYYFLNDAQQVHCSSADWMERNLDDRIEVAFPILKKKLVARIVEELEAILADRMQSWELQADGGYRAPPQRHRPEETGVQTRFLEQLAQNYNPA